MDEPEKYDLRWAERFEHFSRRGFLGIGTLVGAAAITGLSLDLGAAPAFADELPTTPADMADLARRQVGSTLATLQQSAMTVSPYGTYQGDWCAVFAAWLTRAVVPWVSGYSYAKTLYNSQPLVSTPQVGDFVYYDYQHIGVVVGLNADGTAQTVEGNTPPENHQTSGWTYSIVKTYAHPHSDSPHHFSRPSWGAAPPPTTSYTEDDLTDIVYYATGTATYTTNGVKTPAVAVVPDSVWYQERPGAPLFYVAASASSSTEYGGFLGARFGNAGAGRYPVAAAQLGALIELRGQSLQPSASLAPLRTT